MTSPFRITGAARSDTGRVRGHNEDAILHRPELGLWAVADGMGGHERGEWASACVVDALSAVAVGPSFDTQLEIVAEALHAVNASIHADGGADGARAGTTAVALLIGDGRFGVLWAGDSRAYLLRAGTLVRLTSDHTQVQDMVDRGLLTADEAKDHPMSHVLARAIGVQPTVQIDVVADAPVPGDVFLLCSDGLTCCIADAELPPLLGVRAPDSVADTLIAMCLERGAPDNVSVVVVAIDAVTVPPVLAWNEGQE